MTYFQSNCMPQRAKYFGVYTKVTTMIQATDFVFFLVFPSVIFNRLITRDQQECSYFHNYKMYMIHFNLSRDVKITQMVCDNSSDYNTVDLVGEFFEMNQVSLKKATLLENQIVTYDRNEISGASFSKYGIVYDAVRNIKIIQKDVSSMYKRMAYIDSYLVRIFIGVDPEMFFKYFADMDVSTFTKTARSLNVLLFSTRDVDMPMVHQLLVFLWERFSILNIVVQFPCSADYREYVSTYRPFMKTKSEYGQVHIYHYEQVAKYPQLLLNDVTDMKGYPLKVSLFERHPTATRFVPKLIRECKIYKTIPYTSKFYGCDGEAMATLSAYMNFTIHLHDGSASYGRLQADGTLTGSFKDIVERTIDLQGNSRFMMPYGVEGYEFTYIYHFDQLCVIVPKAKKLSNWLATLKILTGRFVLVSVGIVAICGIANKFFRREACLLSEAVLELYSSFLGQSVAEIVGTQNRLSRRIFIASFLLYSIVISTAFSAALLSVYTTETYLPDINTLEEFDKIGMTIRSSINPFKDGESALYQSIAKKVRSKYQKENHLSSIEIAAASNVGGIERYLDSKLLIQTHFSDKDSNPLLHIVRDCPNSYFLSYIVPVGSPYLKIINHFLVLINEAGLKSKWLEDFSDAFVYQRRIEKLKQQASGSAEVYQAFDLDNIKGILIILLIGYCIAFIVFISEVCSMPLPECI
ncbi:hypothetical protein HUJ04_003824 [Dendroctonus ponderosae]|uniref:Ionotropic glutamate receptor C-terminal domain-containing protein n=1 Tax=Dendroctonus ponderosae TaxID=77166 RepID=A0AAR5P3W9_DENPD|nr:hypothetical protein HUJ04_003824 [Dendroctonus ponderosae]KAH1004002.1 hypothetical protein HUJ04_003824 [Dendroctonus ponderosae]